MNHQREVATLVGKPVAALRRVALLLAALLLRAALRRVAPVPGGRHPVAARQLPNTARMASSSPAFVVEKSAVVRSTPQRRSR